MLKRAQYFDVFARKGIKKVQDGSRWFMRVQEGSKWFKKVQGPRGFTKVQKHFQSVQSGDMETLSPGNQENVKEFSMRIRAKITYPGRKFKIRTFDTATLEILSFEL